MTNHVPTLETCTKLKAAGFPQQTEFHWSLVEDHSLAGGVPDSERWFIQHDLDPNAKNKYYDNWCAAPLLTEIWTELRQEMKLYYTIDNEVIVNVMDDSTPAEAAALLWLELNAS